MLRPPRLHTCFAFLHAQCAQESCQLVLGEVTPRAFFELAEFDVQDADTLEFAYLETKCRAHATNLMFFAFSENKAEGLGANLPCARGFGGIAFDINAGGHASQETLGEWFVHLHHILFFVFVGGGEEPVYNAAVIGKEHKPAGLLIKPAKGIYRRGCLEHIVNALLALLGIVAYNTARFVIDNIESPC